jgi:NAD(P)H-dependent FMN reductase
MLLIVWHSRTGASRALAEAAAAGAAGQARLVGAAEALPEHFLAARGYLFVCPENLGTMSGVMKEMFDRCYYALLGQIEGRAYASMIAAGSDGHGAQAQLDRIVTGWRLRRIAPPLIANLGAQSADEIAAPKVVPSSLLADAAELGAGMASGLEQRIF